MAVAIDSTPVLTEELMLENDPKTYCFDAIWLIADNLIMVDCTREADLIGLQNVFLYINTTSMKKM